MENKPFEWNDELVVEFSQNRQNVNIWDFKRLKETEKKLKWFVVPIEYVEIGWKPIRQRVGDMGGYAGTKYFDTQEEANTWIIDNKPSLSVTDVWNIYFGNPVLGDIFWNNLRAIVKSKL